MNAETALAAERLEVREGQVADVRGVVPVEAQEPRGPRHPPLLCQHPQQLVVGEVRKAHDRATPDPYGVAERALDVHDRLQRLREDHEIELPVAEGLQPLVHVGLDHVEPAPCAGHEVGLAHLHSHKWGVTPVLETPEQSAAAAADVEDARAPGDEVHDAVVVNAVAVEHARLPHRVDVIVALCGGGLCFPAEAGEEGANHLAVGGDVVLEQEGVVSAGTAHVAVGDGAAEGEESVHDLA